MKTIFVTFSIFLATLVQSQDPPKVHRGRSGHWFGPNKTVPKSFQHIGSVNVQGFGSLNVIGVGNVDMIDNGFVIRGGGRVHLATGLDFGDPFVYWSADLRNKHFAYTIDVSNVGCKCNAGLYWVNMPGYQGTNPNPGPMGDYYCDAQFVNDNWCPEYDTFEGNAETTNVNLHRCDFVPPNDYSSCDREGCQTNACDGIPNQYCRNCTIDTNKQHYISHAQIFEGDKMVNSNHYYEQDGKTATFDACGDAKYMEDMGKSLDGTVPVFTLWDMGCGEDWIDGCTGCTGCCDMAGASVSFANFQFESLELSPSKYVRDLYTNYNPEN